MRDNGFDRIEVIAEMHDEPLRHLHAGFDPEPFLYWIVQPSTAAYPRAIYSGHDRRGKTFQPGTFAFAVTAAATTATTVTGAITAAAAFYF